MSQSNNDEIIFYSNDSVFSPVIALSGSAVVQWTWADNTTDNIVNPVKNYGSIGLRENRLKVTPWDSLDMINIGYDAEDGGKLDIPFVNDQKVSVVENLNLVAPYLRLWCSSYNSIQTLDFSNFVNLERIECFFSKSLSSVILYNTPKLWRACFEDNNLQELDLSGCTALEDIRGATNNYTDITFSESTEEFSHICVRDNYLTNSILFNNNSRFPAIKELFIWRTNQYSTLKVPSTSSSGDVSIIAFENHYSNLDLRGALRNKSADGYIDLSYNQLTEVNLDSCFQIKNLRLNSNKLDSAVVDTILKKLVSFGKSNGLVDLTSNEPPSFMGLRWKEILEKRSWQVYVDPGTYIPSDIESILDEKSKIRLYPNPASDYLNIVIEGEIKRGGKVSFFDLTGKLIQEILLSELTSGEVVVDVRNLDSGIYFINITAGNNVFRNRFSIIR